MSIDSMTDIEIEALTTQLSKAIASKYEWQLSERDVLYRVEGKLLINLALYYSSRDNGLHIQLQYKMFADDELFFKIFAIEYEDAKKMDRRLPGYLNAPYLKVFDKAIAIENDNWSLENLQQQLNPTLSEVEKRVNELIAEIQTEQDHLNMIANFIEKHFSQHPRSSVTSPYSMQILSALRTCQWSIAETIIRQCLASERGSGEGTEKGMFDEVAYQYLHSIERTSSAAAPLVARSLGRDTRQKVASAEALEKRVSEMMLESVGDFGESDNSVFWVETYLMDATPDRFADLAKVYGAWLGQYLIRKLDGEWKKSALGWGVSVGPGELCYPHIQVEGFLHSGQSGLLCDFVAEARCIAGKIEC